MERECKRPHLCPRVLRGETSGVADAGASCPRLSWTCLWGRIGPRSGVVENAVNDTTSSPRQPGSARMGQARRELTDTMYNPRKPPLVSHEEGTRLVVEHIEEYWCPTVTGEGLFKKLH